MTAGHKLRLGILGFGHLGQFLYEHLLKESQQSNNNKFELVFLWNRTSEVFDKYASSIPKELIVSTIEEGLERSPNLIVEVAHPNLIETYGEKILDVCDLFIGSPTAFAEESLEKRLRQKILETGRSIYVGAGAFWGADDISKMNERGTLKSLIITMKKHPDSFKLNEPLHSKLINECAKLTGDNHEIILYSGPVRELCRLAPNNVNTMAVAAILASQLGFDGVEGRLIADKSLSDRHIVEVELTGPTTIVNDEKSLTFHVKTVRTNPAPIGAVTGTGTLLSFVSSIKRVQGHPTGVHVV